MKRWFVALTCLVASGCFSIGALSDKEPAELSDGDYVVVTSIVKGDELAVEKDGKPARVRLLGIHAFADESEDAELIRLRDAAVRHLNEKTNGQKVKLHIGEPKMDSHKRYLAYVDAGGRDVNGMLIDAGLAMVYTEYPTDREAEYLEREAAARADGKQIWVNDKSVKLIKGLRKVWAEFRKGGKVEDPLLAQLAAPVEQPAAESAEQPAAATP